ncbi:unnamed protein product [Moneuplotes crassus]|uniref:U-box domain-containing protein n=1 Tax=Euplotes crassus TaxID=5936 RepID=A0AAD1U6A1_EUPCR|nr:unnamed protein product [Moneuplotes crassus]
MKSQHFSTIRGNLSPSRWDIQESDRDMSRQKKAVEDDDTADKTISHAWPITIDKIRTCNRNSFIDRDNPLRNIVEGPFSPQEEKKVKGKQNYFRKPQAIKRILERFLPVGSERSRLPAQRRRPLWNRIKSASPRDPAQTSKSKTIRIADHCDNKEDSTAVYKSICKILCEILAILNLTTDSSVCSKDLHLLRSQLKSKISSLSLYPADIVSKLSPDKFCCLTVLVAKAFDNITSAMSWRRTPFAKFFTELCEDSGCANQTRVGTMCTKAHDSQDLRRMGDPLDMKKVYDSFTKRLAKAQEHIAVACKRSAKYQRLLKSITEVSLKKTDQLKLLEQKIEERQILIDSQRELLDKRLSRDVEEKKAHAQEIFNKLDEEDFQKTKLVSNLPSQAKKQRLSHCNHCCIRDNQKCFLEEYFHKYYGLLSTLEKLLICPINMGVVRDPVITPSGNLVEASVIERLILEKKPDPFNRTLPIRHLTINRFATEVLKLVKS